MARPIRVEFPGAVYHERGVDVARDYGYASGNGVRQVVKRLEDQATENKRLKQLLARTAAAL